MYTFLFDILSDTGHVRITLMLASLLHEKGHEVYYTDTSDSVFTSGLLEKGIGRVLYPGDFRWFTPDMVLLDYELQEKVVFYQARNIKYMFITMQLLNCVEMAPQSFIFLRRTTCLLTCTHRIRSSQAGCQT